MKIYELQQHEHVQNTDRLEIILKRSNIYIEIKKKENRYHKLWDGKSNKTFVDNKLNVNIFVLCQQMAIWKYILSYLQKIT